MFDHDEDDFWDDMLIMEMMDEDETYEEGYEDGYADGRSYRCGHRAPRNSEGCYIATAVYGSYDCPEVWVLRRFRDYYLKQSCAGRLFVKLYYAVSPKLVQWFATDHRFISISRRILDKLVSHLKSSFSDAPYTDGGNIDALP